MSWYWVPCIIGGFYLLAWGSARFVYRFLVQEPKQVSCSSRGNGLVIGLLILRPPPKTGQAAGVAVRHSIEELKRLLFEKHDANPFTASETALIIQVLVELSPVLGPKFPCFYADEVFNVAPIEENLGRSSSDGPGELLVQNQKRPEAGSGGPAEPASTDGEIRPAG